MTDKTQLDPPELIEHLARDIADHAQKFNKRFEDASNVVVAKEVGWEGDQSAGAFDHRSVEELADIGDYCWRKLNEWEENDGYLRGSDAPIEAWNRSVEEPIAHVDPYAVESPMYDFLRAVVMELARRTALHYADTRL